MFDVIMHNFYMAMIYIKKNKVDANSYSAFLTIFSDLYAIFTIFR